MGNQSTRKPQTLQDLLGHLERMEQKSEREGVGSQAGIYSKCECVRENKGGRGLRHAKQKLSEVHAS